MPNSGYAYGHGEGGGCALRSRPLDVITSQSQMVPNSPRLHFELVSSVSTIAVLFIDLREQQNRSVELQYGQTRLLDVVSNQKPSNPPQSHFTRSELYNEYSMLLSMVFDTSHGS